MDTGECKYSRLQKRRRAGNKRRAWKIWKKRINIGLELVLTYCKKSTFPLFNKAVQPGKNKNITNIGPMSIP